jgi:hypothetical protein
MNFEQDKINNKEKLRKFSTSFKNKSNVDTEQICREVRYGTELEEYDTILKEYYLGDPKGFEELKEILDTFGFELIKKK